MGDIDNHMACLSIHNDSGPPTVAANPIFLLDPIDIREGGQIAFEIFQEDAQKLMPFVGEHRYFYLDETVGTFLAQLTFFTPSTSTDPALELLRAKPTLRGVLIIMGEPAQQQ